MDLSSAETYAGSGARDLACRCLDGVLNRAQPFDDVFNRLVSREPFAALAERDRAFGRLIAVTALRRRGQIEEVLATFLERAIPREASEVRAILLAASAQLLFLDVAPHAAIGIAVSLAKELPNAIKFSGLINAVLRRVATGGESFAPILADETKNTPPWLFSRWERAYGADAAAKIVHAHLREPPLDLSVKTDPQGWAERFGGIVLPWGTVRLAGKGRIENLAGYAEGEWWVQDAAAALPVLALGEVTGQRVADLCAAPGGKTAQLCVRGADVTAVDISKGRVRRLNQNLHRLRLNANVVTADVSNWTPPQLFDAVLLDAPCSATGTIRRNPDIAYLKSLEDIASLARAQARLLSHAVTLVKPSGVVVYCTCSLEPEEGEQQIARLLESGADVTIDAIGRDDLHAPDDVLSKDGSLRTLPSGLDLGAGISGLDGFFIARLRRNA